MEQENTKEKLFLGEPDVIVDFIRHGQARYSEEELESGDIQGELTEVGVRQIENATLSELIPGIDPDNELVVLWVSPKKRAQQAKEVIERDLIDRGIVPLKASVRQSLADVQLFGYSREMDKIMQGTDKYWMELWRDLENLPTGVEDFNNVTRRTNRVITYLNRIAKVVKPEGGKRLHFILVGHEETVQGLLEESFGIGAAQGEGQANAEVVRMGIYNGSGNQNSRLALSFRGENKIVEFDSNNREILAA